MEILRKKLALYPNLNSSIFFCHRRKILQLQMDVSFTLRVKHSKLCVIYLLFCLMLQVIIALDT